MDNVVTIDGPIEISPDGGKTFLPLSPSDEPIRGRHQYAMLDDATSWPTTTTVSITLSLETRIKMVWWSIVDIFTTDPFGKFKGVGLW